MNKISPNKYLKIDGTAYRNIYVVGDIHGCYDLVMKFVNDPQFFDREQDLLISVGDLIDRGDKNYETLNLTKESWFCATIGNHEMMAFDALFGQGFRSDERKLWEHNGGSYFYYKYDEQKQREFREILKEIKLNSPYVIEVNFNSEIYDFEETDYRGKSIIAHAFYIPNDYFLNNTKIYYQFDKPLDICETIWDREFFKSMEFVNYINDPKVSESKKSKKLNQYGIDKDSEKLTEDFYKIENVDIALFGHTPINGLPKFFANFGFIDVGSVYNNSLCFFNLTQFNEDLKNNKIEDKQDYVILIGDY